MVKEIRLELNLDIPSDMTEETARKIVSNILNSKLPDCGIDLQSVRIPFKN